MAYAPIRPFGPAIVSSSATTLFTSTGTTVVKELVLSNGSTSLRTFNLGIGGVSSSQLVIDDVPIEGTTGSSTQNNLIILALSLVLTNSETLQGFVDASSALKVTVSAEYSTG